MLWVRTLGVLITLAAAALGEDLVLVIDPESSHTVQGWGLNPVDTYYDTLSNKPSVRVKLFGELRPSIVSAVVKRECFDSRNADGTIDQRAAERHLLPQIQDIVDHGVKEYYLTMDTPPLFWKRFESIDTHQDLNPNPLLPWYEEKYVIYIINVLEYVQDQGLPLPRYVLLQRALDIMITRPPGCPFEPDQYWRVARALRNALDEAGMGSVGILGPDASSSSRNQEMYEAGARGAGGIEQVLAVWGFRYQEDSEVSGFLEMKKMVGELSETRVPVWMLGAADLSVHNEEAACVSGVRRLIADVGSLRVSCWFWRTGYSAEATPDALVYAKGRTTRLFHCLKELWNRVRPGSEVRQVSSYKEDSELAREDKEGVEAIAFATAEELVILVVNSGGERVVRFVGTPNGIPELWRSSSPDVWTEGRREDAQEMGVEIEPESVTIIAYRAAHYGEMEAKN